MLVMMLTNVVAQFPYLSLQSMVGKYFCKRFPRPMLYLYVNCQSLAPGSRRPFEARRWLSAVERLAPHWFPEGFPPHHQAAPAAAPASSNRPLKQALTGSAGASGLYMGSSSIAFWISIFCRIIVFSVLPSFSCAGIALKYLLTVLAVGALSPM